MVTMIRDRTAARTLLELVGNTPLLRIRLLEAEFPRVEVYAKAEWFNPGGSVKDRAALAMIEDGEEEHQLTELYERVEAHLPGAPTNSRQWVTRGERCSQP